ncbi:MAG: response regulator [Proteobacteria bacterium]|nr:response regulator [Pseudomonadota bacterium]
MVEFNINNPLMSINGACLKKHSAGAEHMGCSQILTSDQDTWKILVVDDEREVHRLTSIVLDEFVFEGKGLTLISAYSGAEAKELVGRYPDIALILLDVVMETDDAGLDVVRYIRGELQNHIVQIVLRTGQAGQAPQQEVISEYEINDYNSKVELTAARMITTVTSSLRAYRLSWSLVQLNDKLQDELKERKRAEAEIHRLTQFQESVIDSADIWLHVTNEAGQIVIWNKAAETISGYNKEEVMGGGKIWSHLFNHHSHFPEISTCMPAFVCNENELFNMEIPVSSKNGDLRTIIWNSRRIHDHAGNSMGMIFLARDVTEQKMLERQFRQAQKMEAVGRMAGGVAHDFNNLLTVIRGYCELSMIRLNEHSNLYNKIKQIDRAAERAEKLTRQLLAFSRNQVVTPKLIHLNNLIGDMEEMVSRLISTDVELITRLGEDVGYILADPGQIEQIIMNLVVNSRDAMKDGGILCIETSRIYLKDDFILQQNDFKEGQYICLAISDTGTGMDEKTLERIFEPFYTTKEKGKGTGLGLSTVYGIVKQAKGQIRVSSESLNGTRFELFFPNIEIIEDENCTPPEKTEYFKGTETILVVEDQPDVMALTSETLKIHGYQIIQATSAKEAMSCIERMGTKIHLVLTDVVMPGMNGIALAKELSTRNHSVKIIFMSGYADDIDDKKMVLEPGKNYIQKPFSAKNLLKFVRDTLDNGSGTLAC